MTRRFKRFTAILVLLAIAGIAGLWMVGTLLTRATPATVPPPPAPARLVWIESSSQVRLAGSYWQNTRSGAPAILMLHGNGSSRMAMTETAAWLNQQGYAVLAVDLRGHGQSTATAKSFGLHEADDARSALAWLRHANPGARVGAIGFSLGGAAMLIGRQGPVPVDALVLEGVYPDIRHAIHNRLALRLGHWPARLIEPLLSYQSLPRFGVWPEALSPIEALSRVQEPVMVVGGGEDTNTPPAETRALYDRIKDHGELQILPGVSHDDLGRNLPDAFKVKLLGFLDRNLKREDRGIAPSPAAP